MQGAGVGTSVEMDPATGAVNLGQVNIHVSVCLSVCLSVFGVCLSVGDWVR